MKEDRQFWTNILIIIVISMVFRPGHLSCVFSDREGVKRRWRYFEKKSKCSSDDAHNKLMTISRDKMLHKYFEHVQNPRTRAGHLFNSHEEIGNLRKLRHSGKSSMNAIHSPVRYYLNLLDFPEEHLFDRSQPLFVGFCFP